MGTVSTPRVLTQVSEVLREAPADQRGALWRLATDQRQLDANIVRLPPDAQVAAHLEPRLDVLLYVIEGSGRLVGEGGPEAAPVGEPAAGDGRPGDRGPAASAGPPQGGRAAGAGGQPAEDDPARGQRPGQAPGGPVGASGDQAVEPGAVVWLPHGTRRALFAGPSGLAYLTVHRRRPGLAIGSPAPVEREGGDAACLLHRVCVECGRLAPETDARYCGRCGTALPHD